MGWNAVVTNGGKFLFAAWVDGTTLNFDKAASGTGTVPLASLLTQTSLVDQRQIDSLIGGERVTDGILLKIQITAPAAGYGMNQIGVWCSVAESQSVMVAIFQRDDSVAIPSKEETPDFVYNFFGTLIVSNTGEFTLSIDTSAVVSRSDFEAGLAEKQSRVVATGILKGDGAGGVSAAVAGVDYGYPLKSGTTAPTSETVGAMGQHYFNTDTGEEFVCKSTDGAYTWKLAGASDASDLDYNGSPLNEALGAMEQAITDLQVEKADLDPVTRKVKTEQLPDLDYDPAGAAAAAVSAHDESLTSHRDIRQSVADAQSDADAAGLAAGNALSAARSAQETADAALEAITKLAHTIDAIPSQNGGLTYNGSAQTPSWNSYNPETLTLGGVTTGTNAGTYTATFTPKEGYTWSDGTAATKSVSWTIGRATIAATPAQSGSLTYTGNQQSPAWNDYNSAQLTIGGDASATNAGSYTATFTPTINYCWSDGKTTTKSAGWSIGKATITTTPSQSGSLTYTGGAQSPVWNNYNSAQLTISGTNSATNAGTYSATFTPTSNYLWSSGGSAGKSASWTIGKAAGSLSLNKTSLTLPEGTATGTIAVTRAGDGAVSVTSSNTNIATVSVSGTTITVTGKARGSATITVSVAAGSNHTAPSSKTCSVSVQYANVFGVCWNYGSTSTALSRLTKTNDPNSLVTVNIATEPSPAVGTGSGSSPFDSYAPWNGMDEYNIVSNAVSHKRGASGFSRTSYDTAVFIPAYYFKIVDDAGNSKRYFYVADKAKSGFTKHPGSGKYVGRYNTISGNFSKSGAAPYVNMTRATARSGARGKGSKWSLHDYASWCAVWLLYLVEFADWNSQARIGRGYVDGNNSAINSGGTDSMTYHTGRAAGTDGKTAVQYRHVENPWGNVFEWIDGVNFSDATVYVCTNPANYADDTATNYTNAGTKTQTDGWIKSLGVSSNMPWAFFPSALGGSETTYIPDYASYNSGWRVLHVGGDWGSGSNAGLFYFYAGYSSSDTSSSVGARLLFHP